MSSIVLIDQTAPAAPSATRHVAYVNTADALLHTKNINADVTYVDLVAAQTLQNKTLTTTAYVGAQDFGSASIITPFLVTGGGIGYGVGAGGTVTQLTNKSTGVTLSKLTGRITMNGAALAAATIVSFVWTNTLVGTTDVIVLNHISGGTVGAYTINAQPAAGSATINVRNNTAGSLSDAIVIAFAVIKGAIA